MSTEGSVTHWMRRLEAEDSEAARQLWDRYFHRLVRLAASKLESAPRGAADEEDVALSAFFSFCRGAREGRFEDLQDRDGLWRMLVHLTAHKVVDHARRERAEKRGGDPGPPASEADLEQVIGPEPTPEFAAEMAEECRRLLGKLPDDALRGVAVWRMEGWTVDEIAAKLKCAPITVKRKLAGIRSVWTSEMQR